MIYDLIILFIFFKAIIKAQTSISLIWTGIFHIIISFFYYTFFAKTDPSVEGLEMIFNFVLGFIIIIIGMVIYGTKNTINKIKNK